MYIVIGLVDTIRKLLLPLSFPFVFRAFISLVDIAILIVLLQIAKYKKISQVKTAALFFLNPVSVIISGYHGQFENIALLFLLIAVLLHYKYPIKNKIIVIWSFLTISIIVKHSLLFQELIGLNHIYKNRVKALGLFIASILIFLATFIPFLNAYEQIKQQVFFYGGLQGFYGITYFISTLCSECQIAGQSVSTIYKYIFIIAYAFFGLLYRNKDLARGLLISLLFFLTFSSGIGAQNIE